MKSKYIIPIKDLSAQVDELYKVINEESDLACVLIGTSFLHECLGTRLKKILRENSSTVEKILKPDSGILGSFSNRIDLMYALQLLEREKFNDLKKIAEIRNTFAHSHLNMNFESEEIIQLCEQLNTFKVAFPPDYFEDYNENQRSLELINTRHKFNTSVVIISQELLVKALGEELFNK